MLPPCRGGEEGHKKKHAATAAEHPNTPHVSRLQRDGGGRRCGALCFFFTAVTVALLVHLGTPLEGKGLVIHSLFWGGFVQTYTKRRV